MYGWFDWGSLVINIVLFLLLGYGVYLLAKKMHIKNAWMGWVPILQLYTMTQIAGVSFVKYILNPLFIIIGGTILWTIFANILWSIFTWLTMWESFFMRFIVVWVIVFICYAYSLYRYIGVLHAISKRTGRWVWTTIWLFFIPFIMFPVVAHTFKGLKEENTKEENTKEENKEEIKKEEN